MADVTLYEIGLVNGHRDVYEECHAALREMATLRQITLNPTTAVASGASDVQALIFYLAQPVATSVLLFARCREANPRKPIIVLGSNVSSDFAVELVKCGADDFISLPIDKLGLRQKLLRCFGLHQGPAFEWTLLKPFMRKSVPPGGKNRRHCYRVQSTPARPITATVEWTGRKFILDIMNLSIATDGWPGGLLLSADSTTARDLPFDEWDSGEELELTMDIPDDAPPIRVKGQMVRGLRTGPEGHVRFAVQYWTVKPAEEARIRRYWAAAQRPPRKRKPLVRTRR